MIKRIALADFIAFALANLWIQYDAIRFSHDSVVMTAWALTFLAFPIVALAKKGKDIEKDKNINILWLYTIAAFGLIKLYLSNGF